jgi:hypothetical protein
MKMFPMSFVFALKKFRTLGSTFESTRRYEVRAWATLSKKTSETSAETGKSRAKLCPDPLGIRGSACLHEKRSLSDIHRQEARRAAAWADVLAPRGTSEARIGAAWLGSRASSVGRSSCSRSTPMTPLPRRGTPAGVLRQPAASPSCYRLRLDPTPPPERPGR